MTAPCMLPLDSCCCNCLGSICVDSFVAVFDIFGSRLSVTDGLQLAFDPHGAATTKETSYQFLKLCTLCAQILQRLLHTHVEFTRLTASGSYVEVLRQKLANAQAQLENEEFKPDLQALGAEETTLLNEPRNHLVEPATEYVTQSTSGTKQRTSLRVIREQNVKKGLSMSRLIHRIRETATPKAEEKDPLALTDDESEINQDKPRRSKRKQKQLNGRTELRSHKIVKQESDTESVTKVLTSDENSDVDFQEPESFDEECGTKKRSRANRNRKLEVGRKFIRRSAYSNEEMDILSTKSYKCDECTEVSFESYKTWVLHQESVHALDIGYGDVHTKETLIPTNLHFRPCPECGKKYKTNCEILNHMRSIHLELRPYTCEVCHKSYTTKQTLKMHVDTIHSVEQPQYLCILCAAPFKTKSNLLQHEKTHLGLVKNRIECTICHSKYPNQSALREHTATAHSDATPFVCDQCGKAFKVLPQLKRHIKKQHYKKFIIDAICKFCGKGYAFKDKLKDHLMSVHKLSKEDARVSVGSKPPSLFRVLPNGERVFHEKPTKPKTCSFCGRTYVRREQLFTHLISIHAQTQEQAKEITGLESKRNLLPGADAGSRKRK